MKRRFQHQRTARLEQCAAQFEPTRLTATIDDDVEAATTFSCCVQSENPVLPQYREFTGMTTEDVYIAARQLEDLRHKYAEFAVTNDRYPLARPDMEAVGDLQGCRQRFDEHRLRITDRIGHVMEIAGRQRQILGYGAVALENPQDRALGAMRHISPSTGVASAISGIDFADDTAAVRQAADEFMAEHPTIVHVPFGNLDVGGANTRPVHPH